ncbi:MAG: Dam family site-specific DNA-(adenine-N6)-methyltransferase [Bacilli bacterium]|nr:Dam family site-specific DNA-(adenine-N6)-methyltransferase [Bacilli bacterium]
MKMFSINNRRYIGSKARMIDFIDEVIKKEKIEYSSFLDLFGGTGIVGDHFNNQSTKVYVNDLLKSNYISYQAWFGNEKVDKKKLNEYINKYNNLSNLEDNYFSVNFSNTYFSKDNCKKIGYIRENIESEYLNNNINSRERAILITSLLYAMDKIANTVGHYDAYRKNGSLDKELELFMLDLKSNKNNKNNRIFNEDSNELVKNLKADVVYIDPPYNSRQYSDAYHLLENVATWEKQEVFGVAKKMKRNGIKSKYCSVSAPLAFKDLIENIDAKYIIVSYNNMGTKGAGRSQAKISDEDIMSVLNNKGKVKVYETDFNQFNTGKTNIDNHKERLFVCKVGKTTKRKDKITVTAIDKVKSPLNYTGGKYKILNQIIPIFPNNLDLFIDMFSGGANVGINVNAKKIICVDKQKEIIRLMDLFKKYEDGYIINKLEKIIDKYELSNSLLNGYETYDCTSDKGLGSYNKDKYMNLRSDYNNIKNDSIEKDFLFLTLVIYGFNNQIRFNSDGKFNMPVGKRDFNNSLRKNLKNFITKLKTKDIDFINSDFREFVIETYDNTLVYCDPPYFLGTASYNENGGWTEKDELDLLNYLAVLDSHGVKFALSNVIEHKGDKNLILDAWIKEHNYKIHLIDCDYNNSNYHKQEGNIKKTIEILVTNY